ncbi:hypothetical protein GMSM_31120 [Geomonas sp. Red276]
MKKVMAGSTVALLIFGLASFGSAAGFPPPPDPVQSMAKALDLTAAQQAQIEAIMQAARDADASLVQKGEELRAQLRLAGWATSYDEASVQSLAAALAQVEEELTVSRVKTRFQVNAVLTSAQRTLAQKLEPDPGRRPAPPL